MGLYINGEFDVTSVMTSFYLDVPGYCIVLFIRFVNNIPSNRKWVAGSPSNNCLVLR